MDLLAVQGTLKSLLQHHRWKASIVWPSVSWARTIDLFLLKNGTGLTGQMTWGESELHLIEDLNSNICS